MDGRRRLLGTALAAAVAAGAAGCGRDEVFDASFAKSGLRRWTEVQRVAPDRIVVERAGGARGAVVRFEVRHGDHVRGERDSRAELALTGLRYGEGDESTFEWASRLAPDFPTPPRPRWAVIVQWKNDGPGSPPLELGVDGGRLDLSAGAQARWRTLWSVPVVRGRWLRFTATIHWSESAADGWVDLVYQGRHVLDHHHVATLYRGRRSYLKMGLYRAAAIRRTGVVYARSMRVFAD